MASGGVSGKTEPGCRPLHAHASPHQPTHLQVSGWPGQPQRRPAGRLQGRSPLAHVPEPRRPAAVGVKRRWGAASAECVPSKQAWVLAELSTAQAHAASGGGGGASGPHPTTTHRPLTRLARAIMERVWALGAAWAAQGAVGGAGARERIDMWDGQCHRGAARVRGAMCRRVWRCLGHDDGAGRANAGPTTRPPSSPPSSSRVLLPAALHHTSASVPSRRPTVPGRVVGRQGMLRSREAQGHAGAIPEHRRAGRASRRRSRTRDARPLLAPD